MDICKTQKPIGNNLLKALINRNVIRAGAELLIPRQGKDLSGSRFNYFDHVVEVCATKIDKKPTDDGTIEEIGLVQAVSTDDGAKFIIKAHHIYLIDGMDPVRIAKSFGFKLDGTPLSAGKKRGRKPKKRKK